MALHEREPAKRRSGLLGLDSICRACGGVGRWARCNSDSPVASPVLVPASVIDPTPIRRPRACFVHGGTIHLPLQRMPPQRTGYLVPLARDSRNTPKFTWPMASTRDVSTVTTQRTGKRLLTISAKRSPGTNRNYCVPSVTGLCIEIGNMAHMVGSMAIGICREESNTLKCIECHDPHHPPFPPLASAAGPHTLAHDTARRRHHIGSSQSAARHGR